jgi:formate hydrogenlyase subunit 6/NADH:ubiquinone oxidoreductase subunit I
MTIDRKTGHAPRVSALSQDLISVGPCIGCKDCRGLCPALMEMIALPEAILSRGAS